MLNNAAIPAWLKMVNIPIPRFYAHKRGWRRFVTSAVRDQVGAGNLSRFGVQDVMPDMERASELALVARLKAGDIEAFNEVHAAFNARLFNFLPRLSRRRDVAEDLLEETWLRIVDAMPRLKNDTRLGPFLFTIARN